MMDEVLQLLRIADLSKNWPDLRPIHDEAIEKLREHAKHHAEQAKKRRDEAAKAEEEKKTKAAAAAKAEEAKSNEKERTTPSFIRRPEVTNG
jgi:hypothetical protein